MKFSKIEQITQAYERIKTLDQEIIDIERKARNFSERDFSIELSLKWNDDMKSKKVEIDDDGDMRYRGLLPYPGQYLPSFLQSAIALENKEYAHKEGIKTKYEIDCSQALQILGVLLASKQLERREWARKIEKLGVEL